MVPITISSREFNQDASKAKKEANRGPVFITDRGQLSHVLLSIEDYQQLTGGNAPLATLLAMADGEDIIFSAPKADLTPRPAEFE
ncbi:type II toxin-antitoxin system Phd/YefM family antitoxin [Candidatus Erwinia dacicola]|uniref:Antitoxin n=1 Tax=Candidatus Erwinia dacicola TaxID=252393 RepID=A0A1E7YXJ3_9GAMM|nr:type II toxin-antitoxin system Phd/YefM family antitoxin [Candidatus Erwinia dacicola]OFC61249.1 prevent-host-death protein [Candidatus Erwinia dacicola]RAP70077.1 antitoxin, type II toxin-antitoxin system family protein [Candidatus Erwinia dacicola]